MLSRRRWRRRSLRRARACNRGAGVGGLRPSSTLAGGALGLSSSRRRRLGNRVRRGGSKSWSRRSQSRRSQRARAQLDGGACFLAARSLPTRRRRNRRPYYTGRIATHSAYSTPASLGAIASSRGPGRRGAGSGHRGAGTLAPKLLRRTWRRCSRWLARARGRRTGRRRGISRATPLANRRRLLRAC